MVATCERERESKHERNSRESSYFVSFGLAKKGTKVRRNVFYSFLIVRGNMKYSNKKTNEQSRGKTLKE